MHMAVRIRRWTRSDLDRLPNDNNKYEVVHGELFVTPPPSVQHEAVVRRIDRCLTELVESTGLGAVFGGNPSVVVGRSQAIPDTVVWPVMSVPLPEYWDEMPRPLLVVEVASRSTKLRDLVAKRALYLEADVEYWLVDRESRSIRVFDRGGGDETHVKVFDWRPADADRSFTIDVAAIFTEALGPA